MQPSKHALLAATFQGVHVAVVAVELKQAATPWVICVVVQTGLLAAGIVTGVKAVSVAGMHEPASAPVSLLPVSKDCKVSATLVSWVAPESTTVAVVDDDEQPSP